MDNAYTPDLEQLMINMECKYCFNGDMKLTDDELQYAHYLATRAKDLLKHIVSTIEEKNNDYYGDV